MIIGTAGHIDHGKTSLVKALTGVDADRLKEEKERGITIDLGYAYTPLPNGDVLGFVDVPGHQKFIHNMLAGVTGIDFVLLVIAADDGVMPQTREHLQILNLLGLSRGIVALTKIDRVTDKRLEVVRAEIVGLLANSSLIGSDIYSVSATTHSGINALRTRLEAEAQALPPRPLAGNFRLAVDRCFTLSGVGTVVTGTIFSGTVAVGDKLLLSPANIPVRVRSLHTQNRPAQTGAAGQRCALNLSGPTLDKSVVQRGDWILAESLHEPVTRLDVRLYLLPGETKSLRHWTPVHAHLGAADVSGRISILEGDAIVPGSHALAQLVLDKPIGALHGDRFIVRDQSASRTLGGGCVLDIFPPARGKRTPARLQWLQGLESASPKLALQTLLQDNLHGVDLRRFAHNWNLCDQDARALWDSLSMHKVEEGKITMGFLPAVWAILEQKILDKLAEAHARVPEMPGVDRERLRRMTAPALVRAAFLALIDALLANGSIKSSGLWLHLPHHTVTLLPHEEKLRSKIRLLLETAPYQPPRVRDLAHALEMGEQDMRVLLHRLAQLGELFQVAHDHFFTREAVLALAAIARTLAENDALAAAAFRNHTGVGRKLAIQILEFFDRVGYTRRARDSHKLRHVDLLTEQVVVS
ncbi:MAG: selenocysteine-specific translation elongation factor [Sulfuriferula sp.]